MFSEVVLCPAGTSGPRAGMGEDRNCSTHIIFPFLVNWANCGHHLLCVSSPEPGWDVNTPGSAPAGAGLTGHSPSLGFFIIIIFYCGFLVP